MLRVHNWTAILASVVNIPKEPRPLMRPPDKRKGCGSPVERRRPVPDFEITLDLANLDMFQRAAVELGQGKARQLAAWTLNQVGGKLTTAVKRQTAKQLGVPYSDAPASWVIDKAWSGMLQYKITATGKYYSLAHFHPSQFSYGVRAKPWGKSQRFAHAFMLGSEVYARTTAARGPLKKLMGGSIPREMERDAVPFLADAAMDNELPEAMERKLAQFLPW